MNCFLETKFPFIQVFNWSKNNFGEIHISRGLDWAFSLFVPLFSLEAGAPNEDVVQNQLT